jgi:cyclophilin family peptidyl-prolyl cis-trans isomerase
MRISEIYKSIGVVLLAAAVLTLTALAVFGMMPSLFLNSSRAQKQTFNFCEGPVIAPTITVGPFDIHRRYRSMEGPFADATIKMGDLAAAENIVIPEGMVRFTESGDKPSISGAGGAQGKIVSLPDTSRQPPKLFWLKGLKLEVLDENGQVQPTAEFICHFNLDVDINQRNRIFTEGEWCNTSRVVTITQGQTELSFPDGFAVPVASDENWRFVFQAANRTTDEHRRIRQRLTVYLLPDTALVEPITALNWYVPYVNVVVDKNTQEITDEEKLECPLCYGTSRGVNAPNSTSDSVDSDLFGRKITGHWVVPPGEHTWTSLVRDPGFSEKPRLVHAVWSHVHPCCTSISLVKISDKDRQALIVANSRSTTDHGLQIQNIDYISAKEGIAFPAGYRYEIDIKYKNTTGQSLDSMATMGIFYEDNDFARPKWSYDKVIGQQDGANRAPDADSTPIFATDRDGPLLARSKTIRLQTSDGNLSFTLRPDWAPKTATQMAKLFENHVYDGTEIPRYEPGFIFQISLAENKAPGQAPLSAAEKNLIRRIPLEVDQQFSKQIEHGAGMLTMARQENDALGNTTSFSICLGKAAHLDTKYTIFGKLTEDVENKRTLQNMIANWPTHPYIIKVLPHASTQ